jgi:uroporphyrin-III C-methyltransferase/precorrin-2 dehydrogenase/sirohydrochlorin ferrochelatase
MMETVARTPTEAKSGRMQFLARLPVFLALEGKRALIAGGSPAAAWKAELLSAAGARVDIYAAEACDELIQLAGDPPRGEIVLHRRAWTAGDLAGATVAIGACEDDGEAKEFSDAARAAAVPVNVIDRPAFCDFSFGAIVNRSPLVIGISTDGAAPVFAQAIRAKLEALLPQGFAGWAAVAARWRGALKASGLSFTGRRKFWQLFTAHALRNPGSEPRRDDFDRIVADVAGQAGSVENGSVTLVGAGPGDAELLTLRAVRALQSADVILFDDLVSREVLDFARREAKKMLVGKTGFGPSCKQDDINDLMVGLAKQGKRVVRLKGGDPLIFARAGEEIAACRAADIAVEVVPGITAAQGAAAGLGLPLTDRTRARRLQFVTGHDKDGGLPADIDWRSLADPATTSAIYMPARTLAALVARALEEGLDPQTPALAIARATRPDQAVVASPVRELPSLLEKTPLPGPLLVVLGCIAGEHRATQTATPAPRKTASVPE